MCFYTLYYSYQKRLTIVQKKFTLQDNVEVFLKVLVYDASGEFLIERTFGKTGVDENNLQFSYFIPYDGLSLEQDLLSSGLQINLQQIL